jgi:hypothetical protein
VGVFMSDDEVFVEKNKQLAEFLENANKLADNDELYITAGRKKFKGIEYFMRMQKNKYDFSTLSKNAMQILLYCEQEVAFFNIVPRSKKEIAEFLYIKKQNFNTAYKELVNKQLLLNTDFSRKYLIIHPNYGWKGGVTEREKLYDLLVNKFCYRKKYLNIIKKYFDEKYFDILRQKNNTRSFSVIKKLIHHNEQH